MEQFRFVAELINQIAWNFIGDDLNETKTKLIEHQKLLEKFEKRLTDDVAVENWLKQLKDGVYDLEDLLEAFEHKDENLNFKEKVCKFFSLSNPLIEKNIMKHRMRQTRDRLVDISELMKKYINEEKMKNHRRKIIDVRKTHSRIDENEVVGRRKEKKQIVKMLLRDSCEQDITIIPVVGIGGIGKTTVAQLVCNDKRIKKEFGNPVWVYVSMKCKLEEVKKILNSATRQCHTEDALNHEQGGVLSKKLLIILDDAWKDDYDFWRSIKETLTESGRGSKVIVTTRKPGVAAKCRTVQLLQLKPLTNAVCWEIFKKKAFKPNEDKPASLVSIGKEIVKRCCGVPLAAKSLGVTLQGKEEAMWKSVRDTELSELHKYWSKNGSEARKILSSLRLTYIKMPYEKKLCFGYCSVFPKMSEINKTKLETQWLAMGFIKKADKKAANAIAEEYLCDLTSMSFFKDKQNKQKCRMQNLAHDLAQLVAGDGVTMSNLDREEQMKGKEYHYAALTASCGNKLECRSLKRARSLQFKGCDSAGVPNKIFSSAECLRVLDLCGISDLTELPRPIKKMKYLCYLDASNLEETQCSSLVKLPKFKYFRDDPSH